MMSDSERRFLRELADNLEIEAKRQWAELRRRADMLRELARPPAEPEPEPQAGSNLMVGEVSREAKIVPIDGGQRRMDEAPIDEYHVKAEIARRSLEVAPAMKRLERLERAAAMREMERATERVERLEREEREGAIRFLEADFLRREVQRRRGADTVGAMDVGPIKPRLCPGCGADTWRRPVMHRHNCAIAARCGDAA